MTTSGLLMAYAMTGGAASTIAQVSVHLHPDAATFFPTSGGYGSTQYIALSSLSSGTTIQYSTNGSIWSSYSTSKVPVSSSSTLYARTFGVGTDTATSSAVYVIANNSSNNTVTYGSLRDARDGRTYKTVQIGSQTWMAENLNYTADSSWCYANSTDSCAKYGRLYQWAALMDTSDLYSSALLNAPLPHQGLCPSGWHVPSDMEWSVLVNDVDSANAGTALKSATGWFNSGNGSDQWGFNALPAGYRHNYAGWRIDNSGGLTFFWSSSESDASTATFRSLYYNTNDMANGVYSKIGSGLSARCIQN